MERFPPPARAIYRAQPAFEPTEDFAVRMRAMLEWVPALSGSS
jgi:hypothetical protein